MFMQMEKSSNNNNGTESDIFQAQILYDLDLISRFCSPICCRDAESREIALEVIGKTVQGWLDGIGSPRHSTTNLNDRRNLSREFSSRNSNLYTISGKPGYDRQSSGAVRDSKNASWELSSRNSNVFDRSSVLANDRESSGSDVGRDGAFANDRGISDVSDLPREYVDLVTLHLPILLRLSLNCPFVNVREKCQNILEVVKVSLNFA